MWYFSSCKFISYKSFGQFLIQSSDKHQTIYWKHLIVFRLTCFSFTYEIDFVTYLSEREVSTLYDCQSRCLDLWNRWLALAMISIKMRQCASDNNYCIVYYFFFTSKEAAQRYPKKAKSQSHTNRLSKKEQNTIHCSFKVDRGGIKDRSIYLPRYLSI